jgi:hypothetical protein
MAKGGSSNSELLGEAIQKFLAAKRTRSPAYTDKLNADMRLVQSHFGADRGGAIICDRK